MPQTPLGEVLRYLRRSFAAHAARDLTDGQLLERFVDQKEEAAITILVQRHGPMVLSVCERVLGDCHGAEDAFQATFMVLVRRAGSIGRRQPLGGWLYAVAQRIALKARAQATARRHRERRFKPMPRAEALDELTWQELRSVLDEEIARLPEKYRTPIVLCYFEGKTYEQAAKELGLAKSSLGDRVVHGRELLRQHLVRRGITLSAGAVATMLCDKVAGAQVSAILTINTVKAALVVATGKSVAGGCVSAGALALAEEAMMGMLAIKGKLVLMVLALGLAIGGAGWASFSTLEEKSQPAPAARAQPAAIKLLPKKNLPIAIDRFGDPLPEGAVARLGARRFRHDWGVTALAFTADDKALVGNTNSGIYVWDAATGKERHRLPVRAYASIDVAPDGTTLAVSDGDEDSGEEEAMVSLWDLDSGKKTRTLLLPIGKSRGTTLRHLRFTPDGKSLAAIHNQKGQGMPVVFNLMTGEVRASFGNRDADFYILAVSHDTRTLATISQHPHRVQLWDIATGKLIRAIHDLPEVGPENIFVSAIGFAPDGKMLAVGCMNRIFLFEPATGKELGKLESERTWRFTDLAFTPDGKRIVTSGEWFGNQNPKALEGVKVHVWDVATGKALRAFDGAPRYSSSLALSRDGKTVAHGHGGAAVQLWDLATGKELFTQFKSHDSQINSLVYSPDGRELFSAGNFEPIFVWDTAGWQRSGSLPGRAERLLFSPTGKLLATCPTIYEMNTAKVEMDTTRLRIWDVTAKKEALAITFPNAPILSSAVFSQDGRKLHTLDWKDLGTQLSDIEYHLRQWDVAKGKQDWMRTLPDQTNAVLLFPDGRTVLGMSETTGVHSISGTEFGQKRMFRGDKGEWGHLLSADARVLATVTSAPKSTLRLWEIATGKEIFLLKRDQVSVGSIAWSPDGRLLASGDSRSYGDGNGAIRWADDAAQTVRLWDMATGNEVVRFGGLQSDVTALTFSPDGSNLVAGLRDGTILVFNLAKFAAKLMPTSRLGKNELESLWIDLAGEDAGKAHQGIWTLVSAPRQSVPFLQGRLKPVAMAEAGEIQRWISDQNSEDFTIRQTAAKELVKVGPQVQESIQKALKGKTTLEARRRLEQILNTLYDVPGPETLRAIRAIMVLERIGTPEAQGVLEALARGAPGARETEEARASLERLRQRVSKEP